MANKYHIILLCLSVYNKESLLSTHREEHLGKKGLLDVLYVYENLSVNGIIELKVLLIVIRKRFYIKPMAQFVTHIAIYFINLNHLLMMLRTYPMQFNSCRYYR